MSYLNRYISPELKSYLDEYRELNPSQMYRGLNDVSLYQHLSPDGLIPENIQSKELNAMSSPSPHTRVKALEKEQSVNSIAALAGSYMDILPDWRVLQESFNRSLTGEFYKAWAGEAKYKHDVEDMGAFEDLMATALSFSHPLDFLAFRFGKGLGKSRQTKVYNELLGNAEKTVASKITNLTIPQQMYGAAVGGAFPLAVYEGSMGYLHSYNEGERGKKLANETVRGVLRGGVLGSLTSGVSAGLIGRKARTLDKVGTRNYMEARKKIDWLDKGAWLLASKPGAIAVESFGFTAGGNLIETLSGRDGRWDEFWKDFASNSALFTILRAKHGQTDKLWKNVREGKIMLQQSWKETKGGKSWEKVKNDIQDKSKAEELTKVLKDQIDKLTEEISLSDTEPVELIKDLSKLETRLDKARAALSKDGNKFKEEHQEAIQDLVNMAPELDSYIKDLTKLEDRLGTDPKNSIDRANVIEFRESLERRRDEFKLIKESISKEFENYNESKKFRNEKIKELDLEFAAVHQKDPYIMRENKKGELERVNIYDKEGKVREDITSKEIESQINLLKKARGKETVSLEDVEKQIKDTDVSLEGKDLDLTSALDSEVKDRRQELSGEKRDEYGDKTALSQDVSRGYAGGIESKDGKKQLKIKPKEDFKDTEAHSKEEQLSAFEKSSIYIRNLIQNYFPEHVPQAQGERIAIDSAVKQTKEIVSFAEFLAKKGKNFNTMKDSDVRSYLSANKGHVDAIVNLFKSLKRVHADKLKGNFDITMLQYLTDPSGTMPSLAKPLTPDIEKKLRIGVRRSSFSIKNKLITKTTSKKGVPKKIPMSERLTELMGKLVVKLKESKEKYKQGRVKKSDYIFIAEDGHVLYQSDINTIAESLLGLGKRKGQSARRFRDIMKTWGQLKDLNQKTKVNEDWIKNLNYEAVLDIFGLGHKDPTKGLSNLIDMAGQPYKLSKEKALEFLTGVKKEFVRDVEDYLENGHKSSWKKIKKNRDWLKIFGGVEGGKTLEDKYSLVEVLDAFKAKIINKEGEGWNEKKQTFLVGNIKHQTKTKPFKREYSKDTIEGVFRWLLENPSRLIETAPLDPKRKKTIRGPEGKLIEISPRERINLRIQRGQGLGTRKILQKAKLEWRAIEESLEAEGAFEGKTPSQKSAIIKEFLQDRSATEEKIKELEKKHPHREEKESINSNIHVLEARLKKEYKYSPKQISDMRIKVFGTKDFKVARNFTIEQFKAYQEILKRQSELEKSPSLIKKEVDKVFFPEDGAKEIAKLLGEEGGDYTRLKGEKREIFLNIVREYSLAEAGQFTESRDLKFGKNDKFYAAIKNGVGAAKWVQSSWWLIKRLSERSTGTIKKTMEKYEQFTSDFGVIEDLLQGPARTEYNNYLKDIKRNLGKEAGKTFGYWMSDVLMKRIETQLKNKKLDPEIREKYQEIYDKTKVLYKNSNKKGKHENLIKLKFKASMDRIWGEFESAILDANSKIPKESAKYKDLIRRIEKMKVEFYVPQVLKREARLHIRETKGFINKVRKLVTKEIERKAERDADRYMFSKKKSLKKKKLEYKKLDKQYKEAFERYERKIRSNESEIINIKNQMAERVMSSHEHGNVHLESSRFMERTGPVDLFIKVRDKDGNPKIVEAYESQIFNIMTPYIVSTSKFIASLRTAPEFASRRLVLDRHGSGVKLALEKIKQYTKGKEGQATYEYIEDIRQDLMGTRKSKERKWLSAIGEASSMAGLSSFAEPGIKNFLLGQATIIATHDLGTYATVVRRLYTYTPWREKSWKYWEEAKERAERKGAIGVIAREFASGTEIQRSIQESVYNLNLMSRTETLNRIIALETARLEYMQIIDTLIDPFASKRKKGLAEDWLKDLVRFTEKDVELVKSGKILEQTKEAYEKFDFLMDKVAIYSHRATQGGTHVLDVPKFMAQDFKSFFIFQKIATSVTNHLAKRVVKPALKHGNFAPLIKYSIASAVSGSLMQAIKNLVYDDVDPAKHASQLDKIFFYLWRAEFFGMLGQVAENIPGLKWNPYHDVSNSGDILRNFSPVIVTNGINLVDNVVQMFGGYKDWKQASGDWLKETVVLGNQMDKLFDRRGRTHSSDYKLLKNAYSYSREYQTHLGLSRHKGEFAGSHRTSYYRYIKDALYFGDGEAAAKAYWEAYNAIVAELKRDDPYSTERSRHKSAVSAINSSMRHMNPLNYSDDEKHRTVSKRNAYLRWLKSRSIKSWKEVLKAESKYNYGMRKIKRISKATGFKEREWKNKYSSSPFYMD